MKKGLILFSALLTMTGFCIMWYVISIRPGLAEIYSGSGEAWLKWLADKIYPRFSTEKERFPLPFFLDKADQVIIRLSLVALLSGLFILLKERSQKIQLAWEHYLHSTTPVINVSMMRILFPCVLIWVYKDVWWDLMSHYELKIFYKPVLILKILHIGYPTPVFITILCLLLLLSCILIIFNFKPTISSVIAGTIFIIIEGLLNSFEKMNHGEAIVTYCALIFPFLMADHEKAFRENSRYQNAWALHLITFLICLAYLLSGLEKVLIGGASWLNPDTLRNYILLHQAPMGLWLMENNVLLVLLSMGALIFQLSFIFILKGRYKHLFLIAGLLFHAGVYLLLDVGWYINSWVLCYLFFIGWTKVAVKFSERLPFLSKIAALGK